MLQLQHVPSCSFMLPFAGASCVTVLQERIALDPFFSDHIAWSQREPPGLRTTIINGCPWIIIHGSPWISMDTFGYPKGSQPGPMGGELLGAQVIPQNGGGVGWGDVGPSGVRVGLIDNSIRFHKRQILKVVHSFCPNKRNLKSS